MSDDEEEEGDQNNEMHAQKQAHYAGPCVVVNGSATCEDSEEITSCKVIESSLHKPLLSKIKDKLVKGSWKPELLSKLVDGKKAMECPLPPVNGVHKKVMTTLRNGTTPSASPLPLTVRNQASLPTRSSGRRTGKNTRYYYSLS